MNFLRLKDERYREVEQIKTANILLFSLLKTLGANQQL